MGLGLTQEDAEYSTGMRATPACAQGPEQGCAGLPHSQDSFCMRLTTGVQCSATPADSQRRPKGISLIPLQEKELGNEFIGQGFNQSRLHNSAPIRTLDFKVWLNFPGWQTSVCGHTSQRKAFRTPGEEDSGTICFQTSFRRHLCVS